LQNYNHKYLVNFQIIFTYFQICLNVEAESNKLQHQTLGIQQIFNSHTAENIDSLLCGIFKVFKLKKEQVICTTTDGGTNVVKAMCDSFGPERHIRCMCHNLNIFVRKSINIFELLVNAIKKIKVIVKFFKLSSKSMDELKRFQTDAEEKRVLVLIQSVETRWNSEFICARRFLRLKSYVKRVLQKRVEECRSREQQEKIPSVPSEEEFTILEDFVQMFEPFLTATEILSGDLYITSSLVIPVMRSSFLQLMEIEAQAAEGQKMKTYLVQEIKKICDDLEENPIFAKATLLDPRLKREAFQSPSACSKAVDSLLSDLNNSSTSLNKSLSQSDQQIVGPSVVNHVESATDKLQKKMAKFLSSKSHPPVPEPSASSVHQRELKNYLDEPIQKAVTDPLNYWQARDFVYPNLKKLAFEHLPIMSSSTPSERIVSAINCVATDKRSSLLSKNIKALVFLRAAGPETWNSILVLLLTMR
jgi:hypothetical protein